MRIIKDRNIEVFYYRNLEDLLTERQTIEKYQLNLEMIGENNPVKICPRDSKIIIVLLYNSGNKEKDITRLKNCLDKFDLSFDVSLL